MGDKYKGDEPVAKVGGHVVRSMIEEVEEKMAAGGHVSAAPSSPEEAEMLGRVKRENRESTERSKQ